MTIIDTEEALVEAQRVMGRPSELATDDKPECPACGAGPALQTTLSQVPDGALELVILVCGRCAQDHPAWF